MDDKEKTIDDVNDQRFRELVGRINFIMQRVGELHDHVTKLYGLTCDVPNLPPASGHLLLQQRACLRLAQMVTRDLNTAGIKYFLSGGTLLGAARNGRFVPWDDDFDINLMRPDFNRAVELLEKKYNRGFFQTKWAVSGGIFKVTFMNRIVVDLFPMDTYYKRIQTHDELMEFKDDYRAAMDEARRFEHGESEYAGYVDIANDMIMHGNPPAPDGDIFEGIDWMLFSERTMGHYHNYTWRNEYIHPYREIEFCGHSFSCPNNPDAWLTNRFGDWQAFYPEFSKHSNFKYTYEQLDILNAFINGVIK